MHYSRVGVLIPVKHYRINDPLKAQDPREADININCQFAKENGAVYWDINTLKGFRRRIARPTCCNTCCYFYVSVTGAVTYKANLKKIYNRLDLLNEIKSNPNELNFVPEWRIQCLEGVWSNKNSWVAKTHPNWIGKEHKPSEVWLKLTDFKQISPKKVTDFIKWNGQRVKGINGKAIRGGVYIICP